MASIPIVVGMVYKGEYNVSTTYSLWNTVTHDGSTYAYIALTPASGKPLPVSPAIATNWWMLVARRGLNIECQITDTHIQFRQEGGEWQNAIEIADMVAASEAAIAAATEAEGYKTAAQGAATTALGAQAAAESANSAAQSAKTEILTAHGQVMDAKQAALDAADEAEGYAEGLAAPQVEITTLTPGSSNTAEWDTSTTPPTLRLGIARGADGTGTGDMEKSVYDSNDDGTVDRADVADALDPSATVAMSQISGLAAALNAKAAVAVQIPVLIEATDWTGSSAPYTATITVEGITATSKGDIALSNEADAEEREAARNAMISVVGLDEDEITLVADGEKPTVDIPAVVTVLG